MAERIRQINHISRLRIRYTRYFHFQFIIMSMIMRVGTFAKLSPGFVHPSSPVQKAGALH